VCISIAPACVACLAGPATSLVQGSVTGHAFTASVTLAAATPPSPSSARPACSSLLVSGVAGRREHGGDDAMTGMTTGRSALATKAEDFDAGLLVTAGRRERRLRRRHRRGERGGLAGSVGCECGAFDEGPATS
jgi:hypothetical protein